MSTDTKRAPAARIRSRRRPLVRLVGAEDLPPRHIGMVGYLGLSMLAEVVTFDEMRATPREHWPESGYLIPGIGWLVLRKPNGEHEEEDARDMQGQAKQEWYDSLSGD